MLRVLFPDTNSCCFKPSIHIIPLSICSQDIQQNGRTDRCTVYGYSVEGWLGGFT